MTEIHAVKCDKCEARETLTMVGDDWRTHDEWTKLISTIDDHVMGHLCPDCSLLVENSAKPGKKKKT